MDGTKPEARVDASPRALPGERAPLLSLRYVTKRFGRGVTALEGMNLTVNEGDFLSLLGPSGCGKSTALRIIAALSPPSLGRVEWSADPSGAERDRLGIVLQEPTLMPWATVADNVWLPLRLKGVSRRDADARISEALTLVGLAGREKAYPRELSGGMKMRVAIARAMVTRPRLILMDEPFAALDEITRFKLNNDLLAMKAAIGCTVIFVTHSIFESVFLSDRIVVMAARPGRVSSELTIEEPYPRSEDFRTSADYAAYCRATSEALHGAMGDEAPA